MTQAINEVKEELENMSFYHQIARGLMNEAIYLNAEVGLLEYRANEEIIPISENPRMELSKKTTYSLIDYEEIEKEKQEEKEEANWAMESEYGVIPTREEIIAIYEKHKQDTLNKLKEISKNLEFEKKNIVTTKKS